MTGWCTAGCTEGVQGCIQECIHYQGPFFYFSSTFLKEVSPGRRLLAEMGGKLRKGSSPFLVFSRLFSATSSKPPVKPLVKRAKRAKLLKAARNVSFAFSPTSSNPPGKTSRPVNSFEKKLLKTARNVSFTFFFSKLLEPPVKPLVLSTLLRKDCSKLLETSLFFFSLFAQSGPLQGPYRASLPDFRFRFQISEFYSRTLIPDWA